MRKKSFSSGTQEKAILEFYKKLYCVSDDLVFSKSLCKELQEKKFRQRCELGKIGQQNPNQKLNLDIPENEIFSWWLLRSFPCLVSKFHIQLYIPLII
jgi:hypothetical protein